MTIFNYFSQFMATATYILMCHLILLYAAAKNDVLIHLK